MKLISDFIRKLRVRVTEWMRVVWIIIKPIRKLSEGDTVKVLFSGPYGDGVLNWVIGQNIKLKKAQKYYDYKHDRLYLMIHVIGCESSTSLMTESEWRRLQKHLGAAP
jgi:hypothetical protein